MEEFLGKMGETLRLKIFAAMKRNSRRGFDDIYTTNSVKDI